MVDRCQEHFGFPKNQRNKNRTKRYINENMTPIVMRTANVLGNLNFLYLIFIRRFTSGVPRIVSTNAINIYTTISKNIQAANTRTPKKSRIAIIRLLLLFIFHKISY